MKTTSLVLICLIWGHFVTAQNNSISKNDLLGDWVLELNEKNFDKDSFIFTRIYNITKIKAEDITQV
ncbi:MAG: hypothetical protein WBB24_11325, partial [Maribacter sp.]